ncbi:MAG: hypothetical protein M3158_05170, partial [Pseudomonadota bacterium]|nr:hypothetical protein [Pseudomonadota bacterium]
MTRPYTTGSGDSFDPHDPARRSTPESLPPVTRPTPASGASGLDGPSRARAGEGPDGSGRIAGAGKARLAEDVAGMLAALRGRLEDRDRDSADHASLHRRGVG